MNHEKNTPGYPVRLQIVFTLKDGASRAWILSDMGGRAVLVAVPFEAAKRWVEQDQADQFSGLVVDEQVYGRPVALTELSPGEKPGGCGCSGGDKTKLDIAVVGVQKTESVVVGRGRLVSGQSVGEPLIAVAEGNENRVACCGGACENAAGTPNAVVFDKYVPREGGGYEVSPSPALPLPVKLVSQYAERSPACLPWVRVERNPENFRGCLAAARALGPLDNQQALVKLVGEFMIKQDQEVFLTILVDVQLQVRAISEIARGARDRVDVPIPDTLRIAIVEGATAFAIVHNHPTGVLRPSDSDILLTESIQEAAKSVGLDLLDHVIVASSPDKRASKNVVVWKNEESKTISVGYYSFYEHGKLDKKKK
jgi:RadC-like JAB domain